MLDRRSFLALFPLLRVAGALAAERPVSLLRANVAGFRFHDGPAVEQSLRAGQRLRLCREPENRHDPRAVAIRTGGGALLGYVPRRSNGELAARMDRGETLEGRIASIRPAPAPPWERVTIEIVGMRR